MGHNSRSDVLAVLFAASLTAVATALGVLPFCFFSTERLSKLGLMGLANALAGGMMVGAGCTLFMEGLQASAVHHHQPTWHTQDVVGTFAGAIGGAVLLLATKRLLKGQNISICDLQGADARRALLIVGVMLLHSFAEGVSIGVSFGGSERLASLITLSLAVHNVPEGLAVSLVLLRKGASLWQAAFWSAMTSLPQPIMAVPAFLFVNAFEALLPLGLGFAAGAMLWVTFTELMPEALAESRSAVQPMLVMSGSAALMLAVGLG